MKAIDADEFISLSQPQRDYVALITNGGSVNPRTGGEVREALLQFFGSNSETRASLTALLTEPASRITQLYKQGSLSYGGSVSLQTESDPLMPVATITLCDNRLLVFKANHPNNPLSAAGKVVWSKVNRIQIIGIE